MNASLRSVWKGLGIRRKTDPVSSTITESSREGLKDNNNRLLVIVNKFCILIGTEIKISLWMWGVVLDSDGTKVTLNRVAKFRFMHLNSDIEHIERGIILIVLLFLPHVLKLLYRFPLKNTAKRLFFLGQNSEILIPHKSRFLR